MALEGASVSEGELVADVFNDTPDRRVLERNWDIRRGETSRATVWERSELARIEGEHKVRAAEIELQLAELRLHTIERGPAPEDVRLAEIARDRCRLEAEAAAKALERARQLAGEQDVSAETLREAESKQRLAVAQLHKAEADLRVLRNGPTEPERQAARAEAALAALNAQGARGSEAAAQEKRKADLAKAEEGIKRSAADRDLWLRVCADRERKASASGLVLWPEIYEGGRARPGLADLWTAPIITIIDPAASAFVAQATEEQVAMLKVGQSARVELHSLPGRALTGKVAAVGVAGEDLSNKYPHAREEERKQMRMRVYDVVIEFEPAEGAVFQQSASGTAVVEAGDPIGAVVVPRACICERGGSYWALVWRDGGWRPCRVAVASEDADSVAVASGLAQGDRVAILSE
jgi:multidrug resistance efflux pump